MSNFTRNRDGKIGSMVIIHTLIVSISLCLLMMTAGSTWAEVLRIFDWGGYLSKENEQKFIKLIKEKYDVDLQIQITSVNHADKFFYGLRNGEADIILPFHLIPKEERFLLIERNLVMPLNLENIPNYKNVIPALQYAEYCTVEDQVYAVPIGTGPYGLAYNTAMLPEAPTSWNILWDPQFKGKYALGDVDTNNVYITGLAMGLSPKDLADYKMVNTPEFQQKLAELAVNARIIWDEFDKPEDLKGLPLAVAWGTSFAQLKVRGEVWKFANPKERTPAFIDNYMIAQALQDNPTLLRIAEEYLNFALSNDFQTYVLRGLSVMPVTTSVKSVLTPEEIEEFSLNEPEYFKKHRFPYPKKGKQERQGFIRLWKKALKARE